VKALQIANWSRFEASDSRKCKVMQWVAVPINHSGLGYLEIMAHPDGIRMIGGWLLILQVAAQCPTRGLLVADSGRILGAREIALKTRAPEEDITSCIALLLQNGWIEEVESSGHHPDAVGTPSGLQDRTGQDKTGQDKTRNARAPDPDPDDIGTPPAIQPPAGTGTDADAWRFGISMEPWARSLVKIAKIGPKNWTAWKALVEAHGLPAVESAVRSIPASERWPDAVTESLSKSRGQANPADVIAHRIHRMVL